MCYSGLGHTLVSRILIPNKILTILQLCLTLNVSYIGLLSEYLVVKDCIKVLYEAKYTGVLII